MIGDWFVGFRPMLKQPADSATARMVEHLVLLSPVSAVFTTLTSRSGIDLLLDETVRFDPRQGGKLRFVSAGEDGYGGTYSRITVGKRVVLLTERHGELDFALTEQSQSTRLTLTAAKLITRGDDEEWRTAIHKVVAGLERQLGVPA